MTTCSNCTSTAQLQYNISETVKLLYCAIHLPKFLKGRTAASLLVSFIEVPAPKKPSKKKATAPAEITTDETVEDTDGDS